MAHATNLDNTRKQMRRVTWPTKAETLRATLVSILALTIGGLAIWAADTGFVAAVAAFAGLAQ